MTNFLGTQILHKAGHLFSNLNVEIKQNLIRKMKTYTEIVRESTGKYSKKKKKLNITVLRKLSFNTYKKCYLFKSQDLILQM